MKIIFQVDGGMGKCIVASAVCKAIKTQYPDDELIVVSGYSEVFLCNDNVDENLRFNELQYFWQHHIDGQQEFEDCKSSTMKSGITNPGQRGQKRKQ